MSAPPPKVSTAEILLEALRPPLPGVEAVLSPWRQLARSRWFWAGLVVKLVLGTFFASYYLRDLFIPFLNAFVESGGADPWRQFAELDRLRAFPYPPVMLYLMAVSRWLFSPLLPAGIDTVGLGHLLVSRLPLLAGDLLVLLLLISWLPDRAREMVKLYWLSPISLYILYWHGQLDILPTAILLLSLAALRIGRDELALVILGLGLATKSHLWVAVPFVFVFLLRRHGLPRQKGWHRPLRHAGWLLVPYLLALLPWALRPGFQQMVFLSPEQARLWAFRLSIAEGGPELVLAPLAIFFLLFRFALYPKQNWDLLITYLGLTFCVLVTLAPPRPGYGLWFLPFFVYVAARNRKLWGSGLLPLLAYSLFYLAYFALGPESDLFDALGLVAPGLSDRTIPYDLIVSTYGQGAGIMVVDLLFTGMAAIMAGLVLQLYLVGVRSNEVYRLRTRPVLIGLAGDSGSGKDYFCRLAAEALGESRTLAISGDDYHRWPRGHEMWDVFTHLDVRANELHRQQRHAIAISRGESIQKGVYHHGTGQFTDREEVDPKKYVLFAGLHTLALRPKKRLFDLKIFLDPQEELRRYFKIRRDVVERGYNREAVLELIRQREDDRRTYILPQRTQADLVIRLRPEGEPETLSEEQDLPPLRLEVEAPNSFHFEPLVEALQTLPGLDVEHRPFRDSARQSLGLAGRASEAEIGRVARTVLPNLYEITASPRFSRDLDGCLQLVLLKGLDEALRWSEE